jgi:Tol biopolymer transport system component
VKTVAAASDLLAFDIPLRWSADDRAIQYTVDHSGVTNVWQQPLAGGSPKQLTNFSSGKIFGFNWSLNGKRLLLGHGAVTSDIVLFSHLR